MLIFVRRQEKILKLNDGIYDYKSALLDVKNKFTELENSSGSGQNSVISIVNSPFDKNNVLVGYADNAGKSGAAFIVTINSI